MWPKNTPYGHQYNTSSYVKLTLPSEDIKRLDVGGPYEIATTLILVNKPEYHPGMLKQMVTHVKQSTLIVGKMLVLLIGHMVCDRIDRDPFQIQGRMLFWADFLLP